MNHALRGLTQGRPDKPYPGPRTVAKATSTNEGGSMGFKKPAVALCMVASLALAGVSSSVAANNSRQTGLVNVSTGDVALLNGVNLAVAANVIATVCDVTIPVAVLAQQVVANGGATFCEGSAAPIDITQTQPGGGGGAPAAATIPTRTA